LAEGSSRSYRQAVIDLITVGVLSTEPLEHFAFDRLGREVGQVCVPAVSVRILGHWLPVRLYFTKREDLEAYAKLNTHLVHPSRLFQIKGQLLN
jgi:hypothetical protein